MSNLILNKIKKTRRIKNVPSIFCYILFFLFLLFLSYSTKTIAHTNKAHGKTTQKREQTTR